MPPKKKVIALTEPAAAAPTPTPTTVVVEEPEPVKPKSRRTTGGAAAAKHKIVAVVTNEGIQGGFQPTETRKPIIVNLPIKSSDVRFYEQPLVYDPNPPKDTVPFDEGMNDPFMEEAENIGSSSPLPLDNNALVEEMTKTSPTHTIYSVEKEKAEEKHVEKKEVKTSREYGPTKLLVQFENTKVTRELPASTTAACFWTCETFEGRPCVIPTCIIDGVWRVYGNYCNPQSAMAALLAEPLDTHVRWERIALLNMLYGPAYSNGRIYPAPDRAVLQRFGGPMSVEEYRDLCDRGRLRVDIHMPPLISILASMDTKPIDFYESNIGSNGQNGPGSQDTGLKLKRSKPLKEREHTLDSLLGLKSAGAKN
jgi:hypothetical protein